MFSGVIKASVLGLLFFATSPTSSNYMIPSYDFGSGGTENSSSAHYQLNGTAGTQTGDPLSSSSYFVGGGGNKTQEASVPPAPTLSNPSNYYNRLLLVINPGSNPADTNYLIAVSSDGFATTSYVQTDNSIGNSKALVNYRTYASFGSGSGFLIQGLTPNTSYQAKVKALHGDFTETGFGPASGSVATVTQSLTFGLTTTLTATPPFSATFSNLSTGTVFSANADVNISFSTNAINGGSVYIQSQNSGLTSSRSSYTLNSATADLDSASSGYGGQIISVSQTSGGPIAAAPPFNGASNNVGALSSNLQTLLTSPNPVSSAASVLRLKARASQSTPSSDDYTDTLSVVASMNY